MTPESGRTPFVVPGLESGTVSGAVQDTGDTWRIETTLSGEERVFEDEEFETAWAGLEHAVGPLRSCATCSLAILDPYGASNGFDDLSCYRAWPDLAVAIADQGRHAPQQAWAKLYVRRVTAVDQCEEYQSQR
jgi:hypothetical protein